MKVLIADGGDCGLQRLSRDYIRGESSTPLTSCPITEATYCDENVQAGQEYYYVVTAVASNGFTQSADSNEASAMVP